MPIIEGQAVGRPVLTSKIQPMISVAGNGAILVDPKNVEAIRQGYLQIINDHIFRENLIEKGTQNVKQFQLSVITNLYLSEYKKLSLK